jgi:hypothetical protein
MKHFADRNRTFREFEVGDWVYLRLRLYRQMTVAIHRNLNLFPRYYGPFQVTWRIGVVEYKLDLPPTSLIYPIFHVSNLKKKLGNRIAPLPHLPQLTTEGTLAPEPKIALARRLKKKGNKAGAEILIQWTGTTAQNATWEDLDKLRTSSPNLVGKVF